MAEKQVVVTRLTQDQYKVLEKQVQGISVNTATTEIQAGYMLGVQAVLLILRAGFTHETGN